MYGPWRMRLCAWLLLVPAALPAAPSQVGGRTSPDGAQALVCDLPGAEHLKNTGGRGPRGPGTGAGLCVFTSIEIAGRWQNVVPLLGLQKTMQAEPGGGWPEKVDQVLARHAPGVEYVQYSGNDPSLLRLALRTGRCPAVTYGYSPRYGTTVAHMVNLVHLSERWAAVLDNNFPGEDQYEWMAPDEFFRRWRLGGGGWAVVLLNPPPPPVPMNGDRPRRVVGQWGAAACGPVGPTNRMPRFTWREGADPEQVHLFRDGVQVGTFRRDTGCFHPFDGRSWGEPAAPPVAPPVAPPPAAASADFGVVRSRIPKEDRYAVNGRGVDARTAHQAVLSGGTLADDSGKWRLTVVGTADECQRVRDDLARHPALAPWKDRLLVQSYRPDAWAVRGVGLPAGGHPSVVVQQAPDAQGRGCVLHAQPDYADGADGLAGALRRADPDYDAARDPDLRKPSQPSVPTPSLPHGQLVVIGLLLVLLAVLLWRKA